MRVVRVPVVLLFLLLGWGSAWAQCVMCGSGAPYAEPGPTRAYTGFAAAALVLLIPVLGMLVGLGVYMWRRRGEIARPQELSGHEAGPA